MGIFNRVVAAATDIQINEEYGQIIHKEARETKESTIQNHLHVS